MSKVAPPNDQPNSFLEGVLIAVVSAVLLLVGVVLIIGQLLPGGNNVKIALAVAWFIAAGSLFGRVAKGRPGMRGPLRAGVALASVALLGWYVNSLRGNEVQEQLLTATPAGAAEAPAVASPGTDEPADRRSPATGTASAPDGKPSAPRPRTRKTPDRSASTAQTRAKPAAPKSADGTPTRNSRPSTGAGEAPTTAAKAAPKAPAKAAPKAPGPALLAAGSFAALEHDTSGRAEIVRAADGKQQLQLRDFKTDAGPDLKVYLATDSSAAEFVSLGALKGNSGNQVYGLPGSVDLKKYDTVLIWCRAFTVGFGQAPLQ